MEREKYVDESWKESAEKEKDRLAKLTREASSGQKKDHDSIRPPQEPAPAETSREEPSHEVDEGHNTSEESSPNDINFLNYISSFIYQAMVFLGEIPNPMTNETEQNLEQAKFVIETLAMLRTKTKGNLSQREIDTLNTAIYELQMKFVELSQKVP